ncbi:MAG: YtxH domain-containing protein [Chloroflexi bacterium]|nr:YtxH domain-containing protein [Chloroflexota bacterium]
MINENQELKVHSNILDVLTGLLIGGLAGAVTMLLLAPQSGKETRLQIQEKGIELRDRTSGVLDDVLAQIRLDGKKINNSGRKMAKELMHTGQSLVADQLEHLSDAAQAGKKAIEPS